MLGLKCHGYPCLQLFFSAFPSSFFPLFNSVDRNPLVHSVLVHIFWLFFQSTKISHLNHHQEDVVPSLWTFLDLNSWTIDFFSVFSLIGYFSIPPLSQTFLLSLHNIIIMMMMFVAFQFLILLHSFSSFFFPFLSSQESIFSNNIIITVQPRRTKGGKNTKWRQEKRHWHENRRKGRTNFLLSCIFRRKMSEEKNEIEMREWERGLFRFPFICHYFDRYSISSQLPNIFITTTGSSYKYATTVRICSQCSMNL